MITWRYKELYTLMIKYSSCCFLVLFKVNLDSRSSGISVERYSPSSGRWQYVASMTLSRSNFATAVLENKIFVLGGFDGTSYTDLSYGCDTGMSTRVALNTLLWHWYEIKFTKQLFHESDYGKLGAKSNKWENSDSDRSEKCHSLIYTHLSCL